MHKGLIAKPKVHKPNLRKSTIFHLPCLKTKPNEMKYCFCVTELLCALRVCIVFNTIHTRMTYPHDIHEMNVRRDPCAGADPGAGVLSGFEYESEASLKCCLFA